MLVQGFPEREEGASTMAETISASSTGGGSGATVSFGSGESELDLCSGATEDGSTVAWAGDRLVAFAADALEGCTTASGD